MDLGLSWCSCSCFTIQHLRINTLLKKLAVASALAFASMSAFAVVDFMVDPTILISHGIGPCRVKSAPHRKSNERVMKESVTDCLISSHYRILDSVTGLNPLWDTSI